MDLRKVIQDLLNQKAVLERAIALLEELQRNPVPLPNGISTAKRRGRKSMGLKERQQVSARMKRYWAARRADRQRAVSV